MSQINPQMNSSAVAIEPFYDNASGTVTYVVYDPDSAEAVVIDPVLDFDPDAGRVHKASVHKLVSFLSDKQLKLRMLEVYNKRLAERRARKARERAGATELVHDTDIMGKRMRKKYALVRERFAATLYAKMEAEAAWAEAAWAAVRGAAMRPAARRYR